MNNLEQRVREAFDAVELPPEVRSRTLAAIGELEQQASSVAPHAKHGASAPSQSLCSGSSQNEKSNQAPSPAFSAPTNNTIPFPATPASSKARPRARATAWRRIAAAMAACFIVAFVGLMGTRLYFQETAYVDIDVNPSLTLGLNRFDIVVSATPLNADGNLLLEHVSLTGKPYNEAISELTSSAAFTPYIKEEAFIGISVASKDQRQADKLCAQSDTQLSELPCKGSCSATSAETREAAHAAGMGSARYQAAEQLVQLDPSVTLEDCASMSMRELRDRLASFGVTFDAEGHSHGGSSSHQGQGSGQEAEGAQGSGNGSGSGGGQGSGKGQGGGNGQGSGKGQGGGNGQGSGSNQGVGRGHNNS